MLRAALLRALVLICMTANLARAEEKPPHNQDRVPGQALTPEEAIKRMVVPEGFRVEVVASEPDLVNPVAMTIDERGRFWVTESLEYPRKQPGPGKDRIKILEDTDGDGRIDKVSIFAEGLNIPSGIAVGGGGVWVANSPDLLFYKDEGGKAGKPEVVVTGFGRDDTHELPNSLSWGPDGWLYGLNGVFNPSKIQQGGKTFQFTCALWRVHPKTREFQVFCEGTSNPWGVTWNEEGHAFVSACVIEHLWHLTETGYYHRQGGPYPPFTWKIDALPQERHQKAAYCGIHFFDSDAYPEKYRGRLFMGNIHGGCINVDRVERDGASYKEKNEPDFLVANDAWFMPVVQKTGPDGCLYILDWYDRYHCYQDANRDPAGIDRKYGRLYRVRYHDSPRVKSFDLSKETDDELLARLKSPNIYFRELAQRLLCERNTPATRGKLAQLALAKDGGAAARHALWALVGSGSLDKEFHLRLLASDNACHRAWGVRAAGNFSKVDQAIVQRVLALAKDASRDVQVQVAVAAPKLAGVDPLPVLLEVLAAGGDDKLIPHIVWQNLHPKLESRGDDFLSLVKKYDLKQTPALAQLLPRASERILAGKKK